VYFLHCLLFCQNDLEAVTRCPDLDAPMADVARISLLANTRLALALHLPVTTRWYHAYSNGSL
jgi:hypothetical protein